MQLLNDTGEKGLSNEQILIEIIEAQEREFTKKNRIIPNYRRRNDSLHSLLEAYQRSQ